MSKKLLLTSLFASTIVLAGCTMPRSKETPPVNDPLSSTSAPMWMTPEDCKKAVESYLASAKDFPKDETKKVAVGNTIAVDYIGRLADGTVFDTSVESVAKACGSYTPMRDYTTWLPFTVGKREMIAGFDKWVIDMLVGETKTITIPAAEAYGPASESYQISQLPTKEDGSSYKAGESFMTMNGMVVIDSINDKEFFIKNNHPLAGKDLMFDITIKSIQ